MNPILTLQAGLATAVLCCAVCARAAAPVAEQVLPDDTLAMITIPNCAILREVIANSPQGRMWNDPAMKPAKDKFLDRLRVELLEPLERELGLKFEDYSGLAQGQFTIAMTANGWGGEQNAKPAFVLLLDAGQNQASLEKALADFRKKWTDAGKAIRTEPVRGLDFMAISATTNDIPATLMRLLPGPSDVQELGDEVATGVEAAASGGSSSSSRTPEIFLGRAGSVLVAGDSLSALERIVSRLTGGLSPVLADVAQFQSCQPVFFREAQVFGWVNAQKLVAALSKVSDREEAASEEAPDPFAQIRPGRILDAVGLKGLRSAAFAVQMSPEGTLVQFHLGAPESERKGLLKILAGEAKDTSPPAFVPADVVHFGRWRVDGERAWVTLTNALNEISPTIMSVTDYFINTANEAGQQIDESFDLRRQMLGNLGDDFIRYEKKPRGGDSDESGEPPSLLLIGSKAPEKMAAVMKVLFGALSLTGEAAERDFLGRKIYSVTTMAGLQLDPTSIRHRKMHMSHGGGYVLIANDEAVLEEYLRSVEAPARPLAEMPGLLAAAQKVTGPGTSLFIYQNQQESERAEYELAKRSIAGAEQNPGGEVSGMTPIPESFGIALPEQSIKAWLDYSLLPPFEALAKYYGFAVIGGSANVDGMTLRIFTPTPAGLRE